MNQTVHTGQDANESTELGDAHNGSGEYAADGILVLQLLPGVVLGLLVAQRNLVVLGIQSLHIHLDGVAHGNNLAGVLDAVPAQLADVAQAVHAADVHEGTVSGQALHNAGVGLANLNVSPEGLALGSVLLGGNLVDGTNDLAAGALGDDQLHILLYQSVDVLITAHGGLAAGHEYLHALHQNDYTALVGLGDNAFHDGAFLSGLGHLFQTLAGFQLLAGQVGNAFLIVHFFNDEVQLVPNLDQILRTGCGVVGKLTQFHKTGVFGADINLHLIGRNAGNSALHYLTCENRLEIGLAFCEHLGKAHLFTDFFTHTVKYLLNYRRWRGSPGCDGHCAHTLKPFRQKLFCSFHRNGLCVFFSDFYKLLGIGRMMTSNNDHKVAFLAEVFRLLLPRPRRITYCIKNLGVCIVFFYKVCTF